MSSINIKNKHKSKIPSILSFHIEDNLKSNEEVDLKLKA